MRVGCCGGGRNRTTTLRCYRPDDTFRPVSTPIVFGYADRSRTCNLPVKGRELFQLSYRAMKTHVVRVLGVWYLDDVGGAIHHLPSTID